MRRKWEKGDPVSITDLLKITPLANEVLNLSDELKMDVHDLLRIVSEIADAQKEETIQEIPLAFIDLQLWEDAAIEFCDDDAEGADYLVSVKIQGINHFPEVEFKAGVNGMEDIGYFFEMITDMVEKME